MLPFTLLLLTSCTPDEPSPEETGCVPILRWRDGDGDGFGETGRPVEGCQAPPGFVTVDGDCDDSDATVFPGATEVCDEQDTNCDGTGDAELRSWFIDADADGFGDPATGETTCAPGSSLVADNTDCNDADDAIYPGAVERCDDVDYDCDGAPASGGTWYADVDGDGFGDPGDAETACAPPEGWVRDATDCGPDDPDVHPGADDLCEDDVDSDCNGRDGACYRGEYSLRDGIKITNAELADQAGWYLSVGDVTDDGIGDLVISTLYREGTTGGAYVVPGPIEEDMTLDASAIHLSGSALAAGAGRSIGLGDLDGDGIGDVALGAPYAADTNGLYVVTGPVRSDAELETDAEIILIGPTSAYTGHGSDVADVNGDGFDDAVVGAYNADAGRGKVFVMYGPVEHGEHEIQDVADVTIEGEPTTGYAYAGRWVRARGDVNGDGVTDMLVAAPFAGFAHGGAMYVVHGPGEAYSNLEDADGRILGEPGTYAGMETGMGGDLDGDGLADVATQTYDSTAALGANAAHVVLGPAAGDRAVLDADITVRGTSFEQNLGSSIAIGDYDGDGAGELVLGAYGDGAGASMAGAAYLFHGPRPGTYEATDADAWFLGERANDSAGAALTTGDLDADGFDELVVGAPGESSGASGGGAVYVLQ